MGLYSIEMHTHIMETGIEIGLGPSQAHSDQKYNY